MTALQRIRNIFLRGKGNSTKTTKIHTILWETYVNASMEKITIILFFMAVAMVVLSSKPPVVFERFVHGEGLNATNTALSTSQGVDKGQCARLCSQDSDCLYFRLQEHTCTLYRETPYGQDYLMGPTFYALYFEDPCPVAHGYISVSSPRLCLKLYRERTPWYESSTRCQSEGARLLILNTDDRHDYAAHYLDTELNSVVSVWLGMSKTSGGWMWIDGTTAVTTWLSGEPTNIPSQNCVQHYNDPSYEHSGLSDIPCHVEKFFACEIVM